MEFEPEFGTPKTATVELVTADGVHLAADVSRVDHPRGAVVLAHPHPLYGGNRHNPVIDRLFGLLPSLGFDTVRFDFRGGGASGGAHDGGRAEHDDVVAAIDAVADDRPLWLVGYSFGAAVVLGTEHSSVTGWVAVAPPLIHDIGSGRRAAKDPRPKLVLAPEHDQYCDHRTAVDVVARESWTNTAVESIGSTDHFLSGRIDDVVGRVADRLTRDPV